MLPPMNAGRRDIDTAAAGLAQRLPEPLAPLARLAYNYRWTWLPGGPEAFRSIDPRRRRLCGATPVRLLQEASWDALGRAADDPGFVARAEALEAALRDDLARPPASE